jgi:hypothetical protein
MEKKTLKQRTWISFRVKENEYQQIYKHYESSTSRQLSDYARKVLMNKPVNIKYRNASADELLESIIQLKKEMNAIGNNINQSVKRLHKMEHLIEIKAWMQLHEQHRNRLYELIELINQKLDKSLSQWS